LELPNGDVVRIKIDGDYYRINDFSKGPNAPPSNKHFWFRMSGRNLYYSTNKEDVNVLGSIRLKAISDVEPKKVYADDRFCFKILDVHDDKWTVCPPNMLRKKKWICAIRKILDIFDEDCKNVDMADSEITVLTKKVTQPIILVSQPNRMCNDEWDYSRGGSDWECTCQEGKEQSPIDLPKTDDAISSPAKPIFQYDEVPKERTITTSEGLNKTQRLRISYEDTMLKIKDTEFGKIVTLDGSVYLATEILFHTPSEHKINGKTYPMEMQVLHFGQTQGDIGKQVVLSFLFDSAPGAYNKFIDDVDFFNLPNPAFKARGIENNLYIPKIFYNSKDEDIPIMKDFSFYTYQGSMTTPPCTERTIHYVASKPIPLGSTALTLFKEATRVPDMMDSAGNVIVNTNPSGNARKTQNLNGRRVFHYTQKEACPTFGVKDRKNKKEGHYEKIVKKATEYFYVNNERPSRLPGAFVVSEEEAKGYA
jgi:carbonic anhydrase